MPELPAGAYQLKFQAAAFGTAAESGVARVYVTAGSATDSADVYVETADPATWAEYTVDFTLNTAQTVTVGLRSTKQADNFKTAYDHFTLTMLQRLPDTGVESILANNPVIRTEYYNLQGQKTVRPVAKGIYLIKKIHVSNKVSVEKVIYLNK